MARPRRSRRTITSLVVLVLLSVSVISLDESGKAHSLTSGVQSVASDVYNPLRRAVNGVIDPIGRFFAGAVNYGSLEEENHKLQAEIGNLEMRRAQARFDAQQYHQLVALEQLPWVSGIPTVLAATTSEGATDFAATITIDKGRNDGVTVGDPVVGSGGLVGQVVKASRSGATVRLVTDGKSTVGVGYGSGQNATLDGTGANKALQAEFVATTTAVTPGEQMTTDGLQGAEFPAGIPVATVTTVRNVVGSNDKQVTAKPTANLDQLAYVAVLQWQPAP